MDRLCLASLLALTLVSLDSTARAATSVAGVVRDPSGAVVEGALVSLLDAHRTTVKTAESNDQGRFELAAPAGGAYLVRIEARGFSEHRQAVELEAEATTDIEVSLSVQPVEDSVTVTASPARVERIDAVAQRVNVIGPEEIDIRAKTVVAQVAEEEAGVHLQRTSPTMAGIYVRGLTGNKVNVFVDGVRYSTGAQRGGVNTFMNLIDLATLGGAEILRGPSSTQYGSDAIGGSIQFLGRALDFAPEGELLSGSLSSQFSSGDQGFGSDVTASWATQKVVVQGTVHGRRVNELRPGDGLDSHNAVTRFLGVSSDLVIDDGRLPDTEFTQYGGSLQTAWAPSPATRLTASYRHAIQEEGKRYDQLLGGDGNLVADLRDLTLDLFRVGVDRWDLGWLDQLSVGYSFNSQREERVNQGGNGNPLANINHEPEDMDVQGLQGSVVKHAGAHAISLGGDFYHEGIEAPSFAVNPTTGATTTRRGRVPDGARFRQGGIFLSDTWKANEALDVMASLRWNAAAYRSRASDSPLVNGEPLWPDDELSVDHVTYRTGVSWRAAPGLTLAGAAASGFRAPHITDLGTLGLTGSGFEVASPDVAGLGATVGTTANRNAVSSGQAVEQQKPERSFGYEGSVAWNSERFDTTFSAFVNDIEDNITKQTLILPLGAVGLMLGDEVIVSQNENGAVFVDAASNPVLVRANSDNARIWGIEHTLHVPVTSTWHASTVFTYLRARDEATDLPPNIEGGTPAPEGWLKLRYAPPSGHFWLEPYARLVARNDRLSTLDLEDRRSGATRSRSSIANFFNNGARARGLVGPGGDATAGTPDDVLLATGETLAQIQDRVLGVGVDSAPLFTEIPGFALFGLRAGLRFGGRHELLFDLENLGDKNYRGVSWGLDGPGRALYMRYRMVF